MLLRLIILVFISISQIFGDIDVTLSDTIYEDKSKQIIAVELGGGKLSRPKADTFSQTTSIDRDLYFGAIKLGAEDIGLRLFLTYRPMEIEKTVVHSLGIELDSIINLSSHFKFFYGIIGGTMFYHIVDNNQTYDYKKEATGYYGLESGFIFAFSDSYELEIGGRYSVTNLNDDKADSSYLFDQLTHYYLAFNYKY